VRIIFEVLRYSTNTDSISPDEPSSVEVCYINRVCSRRRAS